MCRKGQQHTDQKRHQPSRNHSSEFRAGASLTRDRGEVDDANNQAGACCYSSETSGTNDKIGTAIIFE